MRIDFYKAQAARLAAYLANNRGVSLGSGTRDGAEAAGSPLRATLPAEPEAMEMFGAVQDVLIWAIRLHATSVQFLKSGVVTGCVHGRRQTITCLAPDQYERFVEALLLGAQLDPTFKLPQYARGRCNLAGKLHRLDVLVLPQAHGVGTVMVRISAASRRPAALAELGPVDLSPWRASLDALSGLCLIAGPPASGRSTTLAASVQYVRHDRLCRMHEHHEDHWSANGVTLEVDEVCARILRNGASVVTIDELRDVRTGQLAARLVEAGRLVVATLDANARVDDRLQDLGLTRSDIELGLRAVLHQRLVDAFCPDGAGGWTPARALVVDVDVRDTVERLFP